MDEILGKFIDDFARLVELAQSGQHRGQPGTQLLTTLTEHLAVRAESVSVVVEEIPPHRFVDADILMEELAAEDPEFRLVGIGGGDQRHHHSLSDMLQQSQLYPAVPPVPAGLRQPSCRAGRTTAGRGTGALAVQPWRQSRSPCCSGTPTPGTAGSQLPLRFWPALQIRPHASSRSSAVGCSTAACSRDRSFPW